MLRCLVLGSFLLVACSSKKQESASSSPEAVAEARNTFNTFCSTCHGQNGKGDGPGAANLNPKPRNYTDKQWQASVTDDQIKKIILEGGAAVGKSPMMPANPQFRDKPEVVNELVKIVRSFGQ
ncbi:MAG TPA: cytochrome c [Kofleriaceae bacterium]|nr:cytochrome c [Kofleriaceae bacterium]